MNQICSCFSKCAVYVCKHVRIRAYLYIRTSGEAMYVYRYACISKQCIASYNLQLERDAQCTHISIVGTSWCTMIPLTSFPLNVCNILLHALWPAALLVLYRIELKHFNFNLQPKPTARAFIHTRYNYIYIYIYIYTNEADQDGCLQYESAEILR